MQTEETICMDGKATECGQGNCRVSSWSWETCCRER